MGVVTDLPSKLCSWQRKCQFTPDGDTIPYHEQVTAGLNCPTCGGTGLVYVLDDSVRVPSINEYKTRTFDEPTPSC